VEKADVEVVFMGVQPQLILVVLDEKAMRQEQHMIFVQRKITCHVLHASIWLTMDRVAPAASIPLFAPCIGTHNGFFSRGRHDLQNPKVQDVDPARRPAKPPSLSGLRTT
jgi:hypothetical protein